MVGTLRHSNTAPEKAAAQPRVLGSCGLVAEQGIEAATLIDALERLGITVITAQPELISDELWRGVPSRVVLARGPRAVVSLASWLTFIHATPHTATLALLDTSRAETIETLATFDAWLPMSTNPTVVAQAVHALLRLLDRETHLTSPRVVRGYNLIVDLAREEATDGTGNRIPLTPSEFRLLAALAVQPGRTLDFGQLGLVLPGHFRDADDAYNSVKVHIGRLRAKLARATGWDGHLVSVRGRGFFFERRHPGKAEQDTPAAGTRAGDAG